MNVRWGVVLLVVLGGIALAGCTDSEASEADEPPIPLGMFDNFYSRDVLQIPVGRPVTFVNDGQVPHNAIASDGSWQTEEFVEAGERSTVVIDEPGVHRYFCSFHGTAEGEGMVGTLVVGDVDYDPSGEEGGTQATVAEGSGVTRDVPGTYPDIQAAVDAAEPGDLVLVSPGVYREEVKITTPSLTVRGTDRNQVIIDGEFQRPNGISITADGVAVENLTVRNAALNGLFWTNLTGYRASYVTAENNKVYGIYAFDATDGLFEHSFATGSYDAGFYIGQCDPCNAVITDVVAENNGLGYSGTNASGNVHIVNSVWRHNVSGIVPNSLDSELLPPVERVHIAGNLVHDNSSLTAPVEGTEWTSFGNGIIVAGGNEHLVERNLIVNHPNHGILVTPNLDRNFWTSSGNEIRDNHIEGSGRADVALSGPAGPGNCFSGNDMITSVPIGLETFQSCDGMRLPFRMDLSTTFQSLGYVAEASRGLYPTNLSEEAPPAPPQEQMPGGAAADVVPAVNVYERLNFDPASITMPEMPVDLAATTPKELTVFGIPIMAVSFWQVLFGLYGYLLPFVLYAAWLSLALWDLARRDDLSRPGTLAWIAAVLLVPFFGVIAYHIAGRSKIPAWLRGAVVGGGLASYLLILAIGAALGGIV